MAVMNPYISGEDLAFYESVRRFSQDKILPTVLERDPGRF